jgi:hypothetical protein
MNRLICVDKPWRLELKVHPVSCHHPRILFDRIVLTRHLTAGNRRRWVATRIHADVCI